MDENIQEAPDQPDHKPVWKRTVKIVAISLAALVLVNASYVGYLFTSTPVSIRQPLYEHYHFRLQLIVDGKPVNFADAKYQEGYSKDNCNAALTTHPIHFHDDKDQFVHIHWEGMTGGQVLKYYGWNLIGGKNGSLGYRFDQLPKLQNVTIHGNVLPAIPDNAKFYVYTGDENGYKERSIDEFKSQDLEKFLGKTSNSPAHKLNQQKRQSSLLNKLEPTAYAHEAEAHSEGESALSTEQLTRLNNLIGNTVIFVQDTKPSDAQIKARFNDLEPLTESACAG